jgi:hypothetical protein
MTQDVILGVKTKNPKFVGIFSYKLDLFRTFIDEKILFGKTFLFEHLMFSLFCFINERG